VFGFFAPGIYIKNLTAKRQKRMQLGLPDALDLMIICAEAGLSLDATLVRVSRELANACPDLAEELAITSAELTFLPDRRLAFENLNARTDMSSIRGVVNTLMQTAKFGTPLAQSLRVLATEYRDARMFRAEEKAARLPALMTVPMIMFILPTLFIVLMGPAALGIIDTFNHSRGGPQHVTVVSHDGSGGGGSGASAGQPDVTEAQPGGGKSGGGDAPQDVIIEPAQQLVPVGQSVAIGIDARALAGYSDLRIVIVPKDTPDSVSDPKTFFTDAKAVAPTQMQVELTPRIPGESELRLYAIPRSGGDYTVMARMPMMISSPDGTPAPSQQ
jgi:hypothetical protein